MKPILEENKYKWDSTPYQRRVLSRALRGFGYTTFSHCNNLRQKISPVNFHKEGKGEIKYMEINDKYYLYGKTFRKKSDKCPGMTFSILALSNFKEKNNTWCGWTDLKRAKVHLIDGHLLFTVSFDRYNLMNIQEPMNMDLFINPGSKIKVESSPSKFIPSNFSTPPLKLYMNQIIIKKELIDIKAAIDNEYIYQDKLREKQSEAAKAKKSFRHIESK